MKETKGRKHKINQDDVDEMVEVAIREAIRVALSPESLERTISLCIDKMRGRVI